MTWEQEKEALARDLTQRLYRGEFIQTLWNTTNTKFQKKGWDLKSGIWSPWFLNLRPIGKDPQLVADVGYAMALTMENEIPDTTRILGVEMAGVPIAAASSVAYLERAGKKMPFSYTRPLPEKPRDSTEAAKILSDFSEASAYGMKEFVEGEIASGDVVAVWDDMVTSLESKLIARLILYHDIGVRNSRGADISDVRCDYTVVLLDREQGAAEAAQEHDPPIKLCSVIPWNKGLPLLKDVMDPDEYGVISGYHSLDMQRYRQDPDFRNYIKNHVLEHRKWPSESQIASFSPPL